MAVSGCGLPILLSQTSHVRDWIGRQPGDWPTEHEENGNYLIQCRCGRTVSGPKRAPQCYICHQEGVKYWESLTLEQQKVRMVEVNKVCREIFAKNE